MDTLFTLTLVVVVGAALAVLGYLLGRRRSGSELRSAQQGHSRLTTDLKVTEEQRDQARSQTEGLRTERDDARRGRHESENRAAELASRLNTVSEERARSAAELDTVRDRFERATTEVAELKSSLETSHRKARDLETELATAHKDQAASEAVGEQLKGRVHEYETELSAMRAKEAELEKRQAEVDASRQQFEEMREEHARLHTEQVEATVSKMLSLSQEKLTNAADQQLGATAKEVNTRIKELGQYMREFEGRRTSTESRLDEQIKTLAKESTEGRKQTESLVEALRKSHVRGQWGELQLQRAVEMAGLRERCDFDLQVTVEDEGKKTLRPDMVVNLTGSRRVVVDAKVPFEAFLKAVETREEAERARLMGEHLRQVRTHVDALAAKKYHDKVEGSADFVLMFLPSEALLQAAMDQDAGLVEYALKKKVVITSPAALVSVLRTIALSWDEREVQENTEEIRRLGREIYERLATMSGHLAGLGKSLEKATELYNRTIGSLEGRVLVTAREFTELGVRPGKELKELPPMDARPRLLAAPELTDVTTAVSGASAASEARE